MLPIIFVIRFPTQLWSRADFKLEQVQVRVPHRNNTNQQKKNRQPRDNSQQSKRAKFRKPRAITTTLGCSLCPLLWSESSVSIKSQGSFTEAQNQVPNTESHVGQCKLPERMALVKCPCAFRLRRLAQNAVPGKGVHLFS